MSPCVFSVYLSWREITDGDNLVVMTILDAAFEPFSSARFTSVSGSLHKVEDALEPRAWIGTPRGWRLQLDRGEKVLMHPERPEMRVAVRDAIALAAAGMEGYQLVDQAGVAVDRDREPSFTLAG